MTKAELKAERKKVLGAMKAKLGDPNDPQSSNFYYHPNQDHIVLSHALFWVMSKPLVSKLPHHQAFLLLRQYEGEMLEAYLTESEDFEELLGYCNTVFDTLPYVAKAYIGMGQSEKHIRKLSAMAVIAGGYGGDMDTDAAYDLLDDMDFDRYGKVCCLKIERMLPMLNRMVEEEIACLK